MKRIFITLLFCACSFASSISDVCRQTAVDTFKETFDDWNTQEPKIGWEWTGEKLSDVLYHKFTDEINVALAPWLLESSPLINHREAAHLLQMRSADDYLKSLGVATPPISIFEKYASDRISYSDMALGEHARFMAKLRSIPEFSQMKEARDQIPSICSVYRFPRCEAALMRTLDLMGTRIFPDAPAAISLLDVIDEIFREPIYRRAAARFSLVLNDKIQSRQFEGELFKDLKSSFVVSGDAEEEAEAHAIKLMGFYGTRGVSLRMVEGLTNSESYPLFSALFFFSTAMGIMDAEMEKSGQSYSYPNFVRGLCVHGRPYHFWLAAYLSNELRAEGFSKQAAFMATHVLGMLYEFAAGVAGKKQYEIYLGPFLSTYNNNVRENIAYDDLGAAFGLVGMASGIFEKNADIELILSTMLRNARPMPQLTEAEIKEGLKNYKKSFRWFHRVIAPDANVPELLVLVDRI